MNIGSIHAMNMVKVATYTQTNMHTGECALLVAQLNKAACVLDVDRCYSTTGLREVL